MSRIWHALPPLGSLYNVSSVEYVLSSLKDVLSQECVLYREHKSAKELCPQQNS